MKISQFGLIWNILQAFMYHVLALNKYINILQFKKY